MHASFEQAHSFTARWEGGLVDHPSDPGGVTNHGVSLRWLKQLEAEATAEARRVASSCDGSNAYDRDERPYDFNGDGKVDGDDIRACTREQAAELMRRHFWSPLRCEELPAPLAAALYDCAVNTGPDRAIKILQEACNVVGEAHLDFFTPLAVDGRCGAKTLGLAGLLQDAGLAFYTARLCVRERKNFYIRLTKQKPQFAPFLQGWKNRCDGLLNHLAAMEREA